MTCDEMRERMLSGPPDAQHRHLDDCESCRTIAFALRDAWQALDEDLTELGDAVPFADALHNLPPKTRNRRSQMIAIGFNKLLLGMVAAAAIVLAMPSLTPTPVTPDPSVTASPGVSAPDLEKLKKRLAEIEQTPWNTHSAHEWGLTARELSALYTTTFEPDFVGANRETQDLTFRLLAQIGRAAENAGDMSPPFFRWVHDQPTGQPRMVNYYWYLASRIADEQRLSELEDELKSAISLGYGKLNEQPCRVADNRMGLKVIGGSWEGSSNRVDLLIDRSVVMEDIQIVCFAPGQLVIEVPLDRGPALQERVDASRDVHLRSH